MTLFGKMLFAGVIELRRGHGGSAQCPCSLSHVQLFAIPWTVAHQAPLSMGFSRQEYWSGLPYPPPGDLPNPGIEPVSLTSLALAGGLFTTSTTWEAQRMILIVELAGGTDTSK